MTLLSTLDLTILAVYLVSVLSIGLYMKKRASGSIENYFLGGRTIPWFILGLSGMAAFLDMSGTMLQTSFFYFLGAQGYWVTLRGAVALFLAFYMIFMSKWVVRTHTMTIAELIAFRFGTDWHGKLARVLSATSALIISITMISWFFVGAGKFFHLYFPEFSPQMLAIAIFAIVMVYTVTSGFMGVVVTDIFQGILITGVIIYVTWSAMTIGTPAYFAEHAPADWRTLFPTTWRTEMPLGYESLEMLALLIVFWLFSNILQGFASPLDALSAQRFFAAKDERTGAMTAMQWILLMSLRFLLMMSIAVIAISLAGEIVDPEVALPVVIERALPIGIKGAFIAALLAAFMSTVEALANSSAAYFVRDIYQPFIKAGASEKHYVRVSYVTTAVLFTVGGSIGMFGESLNVIWAWLIMGFLTGIIPPSILKWVWWRFNAMGYVCGMTAGITGAGLAAVILGGSPEYTVFTFVIICSTVGTFAGVYLWAPTEMHILKRFYGRVAPFGWWGPVKQEFPETFVQRLGYQNRRDLLLLIPACTAQLTIFWIMVAIVIKRWDSVLISGIIVLICAVILYWWWYRNLGRGTSAATDEELETAGVSSERAGVIG